MSVESITVVLHHSRSSGTDRLVMVGIANHDGDGGAYPTIEKLMKYTGRSERAVQDAISRLVALGELRVHKNAGGSRQCRADRRPNRYEILVACPADCDGTREHRVPGPDDHGVRPTAPGAESRGVRSTAPTATRGAVHRTDGVQPTAPEPSLNRPEDLPLAATAPPHAAREELRRSVMAACGLDGRNLTKSARGAVGAAVAELAAIGAHAADVEPVAARYRRAWPDARLTPSALAKHWPQLASELQPTTASRQGPAGPGTPVARAAAQGRALALTDFPAEQLATELPPDPELADAFASAFHDRRARSSA